MSDETTDLVPVEHGMTLSTLESRFWAKASKGWPSGCWLWLGATISTGYGTIGSDGGRNGRSLLAHRVSWELHNGPIPAGLNVLHRCDTPACVNPGHLFLGDQRANAADALKKGRLSRGEQRHNVRLRERDIATIRARLAAGERTASIAADYGVSRRTISAVKNRQNWAWIPGEAS